MLISPGMVFMVDISCLSIPESIFFIEMLVEVQTSWTKSPETANDPVVLKKYTSQIIRQYVAVFIPVL